MKATIEFDDALYKRLKVEAARRGRTVRALVAEGVQHVLDAPDAAPAGRTHVGVEWKPEWLGSLARYGRAVADHTPSAVRESVERARAKEQKR